MDDSARLTWHEHEDSVPAEPGLVVDQGLGDANEAAAPLHEVRPMSCFVHKADGHVIGGAVGRRWGRCGELQQLWVDASQRRQGLGAQLVRRFEDLARRHGCTQVYLETFSFQAPRFYRALGYRELAAIDGFAPGIVKFTMLHPLNDA
ncbi:GNAT family N-acetyltransferase [Ideonella sp. A 288]|uniref:GNAT family N-acetyltransferase n=1 Tax=Ideonella sp. A 288 TaxID=1962181 RepID=UPI000B4BDB56|nr:GNAT family N-acetyltransferase [Ideonella sp. A 288]